jgi:hypothetical protein
MIKALGGVCVRYKSILNILENKNKIPAKPSS